MRQPCGCLFFVWRAARALHTRDSATCQPRAFHRRSGGEKKPRLRGVVGRLLVWRSVFSLLSGARGIRRFAFIPDPAFLLSVALARLLPKGAAAPLMPVYEQHACQRAGPLKRCDMLRPGGCTNVTRRTIRGRFSRSNPGAPPRTKARGALQNSGSVKIVDAFHRARLSAGRPGEHQVVEFD